MFRYDTTEIDKLLTRLFQIGIVAIDDEVKMWLTVRLMDTIDLITDMLFLLLIEVVNLLV